ncbi:MAG: tRNA lysidine(34) synthetase TilS [Candidatus Edwardsbacteria bacterium]|nr:tRNA lysidine(34) synthetase TilS [Candidatus Edwardsbacteria bacterium]
MHKNLLVNKMREFIVSRRLIKPRERVLVALSGGPDSVFLLHALLDLREDLKITLLAGHLNHRLRGAESDKDEAFVKVLAKKEGVKLFSAQRDVAGYAKRHKLSIETAARELRREFLIKTADRYDCQKIATGHNLNDQAETVLMHIIRGSGLTGLKGIPAANGKFIRPMLGIGREEILEYLRVNKIEWREDSSNKSPEYSRNKIRLTLIPQLKEYNPQIAQSLSHLAESAGSDLELVDQLAEQAFRQTAKIHKAKINIDLSLFNSYNKGLQRNVLRLAVLHLARQGVAPSFEAVENCIHLMAGRVGSRWEVLPGIWCITGYKTAEIVIPPTKAVVKNDAAVKKLAVPGKTIFNRHLIISKIIGSHAWGKILTRSADTAYYDWDRLKEIDLTVGKRRPGDAMVPFGSSHRKKTKEIFIEAKVPRAKRDLWPVIRCGDQIIWLAGLKRSNHAPVNRETKNILKLEFVS